MRPSGFRSKYGYLGNLIKGITTFATESFPHIFLAPKLLLPTGKFRHPFATRLASVTQKSLTLVTLLAFFPNVSSPGSGLLERKKVSLNFRENTALVSNSKAKKRLFRFSLTICATTSFCRSAMDVIARSKVLPPHVRTPHAGMRL